MDSVAIRRRLKYEEVVANRHRQGQCTRRCSSLHCRCQLRTTETDMQLECTGRLNHGLPFIERVYKLKNELNKDVGLTKG